MKEQRYFLSDRGEFAVGWETQKICINNNNTRKK
jgi:hypothetical protein